jgi:Fe-S oxidoreductase/nitrate reductase gamma subunit
VTINFIVKKSIILCSNGEGELTMIDSIIFFLTAIMPYIALIVLVNGLLYRTYNWARSPKPTTNYKVHPITKSFAKSLFRILKKVFIFPILYRDEKILWIGTWLFHISLLMSIISHYKVFANYMWFWENLNISTEAFADISIGFSALAAGLMVFSLIFLFGRRFLNILRKLSDPEDYIVILFILAIAISGIYVRFIAPVNLLELRRYFVSLAQLNPAYLPTDTSYLIHHTFVLILILYFPLGKLVHTLGGGKSSNVGSTPTTLHKTHQPEITIHMKPSELAQILEQKFTRTSFYHLDLCARCGACNTACHMYTETKEPIHSPAYKISLLRRVHKRYYTVEGKVAPKLFKTVELSKENLLEISHAMFECTICRRCTIHCPFGVDTPYPISDGRYLFLESGKAPDKLAKLAKQSVEKATHISEYEKEYREQTKNLELQLQRELHDSHARITLKDPEADVLYVPLEEGHGIISVAKIFNAANENWTLSEFDSVNYNFYLGNLEATIEETAEIIKEAENLGVKTVVISESGHGLRIMKHLAPQWFNRTFPFEIKSIAEIMAQYIQEKNVKVDPKRNPGIVTYHDPCHVGRNSGIYEEPRIVLGEIVEDFREMKPNREYNWCCGAGGGIIAIPEFKELRMKTGKKKVDQIKNSQANIVTSLCEDCRLQINDLKQYYNLDVQVASLTDLMANAVIQSVGER